MEGEWRGGGVEGWSGEWRVSGGWRGWRHTNLGRHQLVSLLSIRASERDLCMEQRGGGEGEWVERCCGLRLLGCLGCGCLGCGCVLDCGGTHLIVLRVLVKRDQIAQRLRVKGGRGAEVRVAALCLGLGLWLGGCGLAAVAASAWLGAVWLWLGLGCGCGCGLGLWLGGWLPVSHCSA